MTGETYEKSVDKCQTSCKFFSAFYLFQVSKFLGEKLWKWQRTYKQK